MLNIRFEAQENQYLRVITFPDGTTSQDVVSFRREWHDPEPYPWIKPLYELERQELAEEGKAIAAALLGTSGVSFLTSASSADPLPIVIQENGQLPEVARIPWELAFADGRFLATDPCTPVLRRPPHIRPVNRLTTHYPLRMALISAAPKDQQPLMVEEELITIALSLDEPMAAGRLVVDEIMNCTREKLKGTLRGNRYDIVYFTGHGAFQDNAGCLCLEKPDGATDPMSADDFAFVLRSQKGLSLLFLNCCNAASVGTARSENWEGFGDVARKAMKQGPPEVVATQSAIFDSTGRRVMKSFFEELCRGEGFDVAAALALARGDVEDDQSQFHDFYQFVHLSLLEKGAIRDIQATAADETERGGWRDNVCSHTPNRMDIGGNFVGRFSIISRIEEAWWNDAVKIVGIHGLGGIGKTFLCGRMEQRALTHHLPAKRLNKSIWLDFRDGTGSTLAGFLRQMDGIARDFGFQAFNRVLDDQEAFPAPLEKFRPWFDHIDRICKGNALLILDNLESALDGEGMFRDPELGAWFIELLARSPGWKVLVTCRHRFDFFPGRRLASDRWLHLAEMGITERLALLNRDAALRDRQEMDKREILKATGGHPYIINLVANYLRIHPELPEALRQAALQTSEYAQLDWFLSLLTPDELDWLLIAALFPPPKLDSLLVLTKISRDRTGDPGTVEASFHAAVRRLAELSLAGSSYGELQVHSLISWQLLENRTSSHLQTEAHVDAILWAIAVVFLNVSKDRPRPQRAMLLIQGVEPALAQSNRDLLVAYLHECAAVFLGFVSAAVFADIVRRAEAMLFEAADEVAFHTLAYCAQVLCQMQHFTAAAGTLTTLLQNERLSERERGNVLGALGLLFTAQRDWPQALENFRKAIALDERIGTDARLGVTYHNIGIVYHQQRAWPQALESYQKALEWKEKTGQHHQLGSTWHQIGIVYEEQRDWPQALENYQKALEWNEKTGQYHELGGTWHQIGIVYEEQRDWPQALESYQKALEWNEKTGQHHQLGSTWHQIGIVYEEQRDWPQALESYQKALELYEKTGQHHKIGGTWHQIGRVYEEQRVWPQALESYQKALEWHEKTGQHHELGGTWHQIGRVYEEQRVWPQALESYQKALELYEKTGQHHKIGGTWHQIGRVYEEQGDFVAALRNYLRALALFSKMKWAKEAGIAFGSIRRIFPNLSSQEKESLKEALPEEMYRLLEKEENLLP